MRSRAKPSPLSARSTQVLIRKHPPTSPEKWKYKGGCAVSPLKRGKCGSAAQLQLLVLKEHMEIEPVSHVLGEEEEEEGWGQKKM